MTGARPASRAEAIQRARALLTRGGAYALGTGDYRPRTLGGNLVDVPWTEREKDHAVGCDCAGLICWAYKLQRHRPGYNRGGRFDVEDDINCNSMLGDAFGANELFRIVTADPLPGDVLAYPSFYLYDKDGKRICGEDGEPLHWIGHVCLVVGIDRTIGVWNPARPRWDLLDVIQVKGPDGRSPAAIATDGSIWMHHDETWPKPAQRSWLMRAVPRSGSASGAAASWSARAVDFAVRGASRPGTLHSWCSAHRPS